MLFILLSSLISLSTFLFEAQLVSSIASGKTTIVNRLLLYLFMYHFINIPKEPLDEWAKYAYSEIHTLKNKLD